MNSKLVVALSVGVIVVLAGAFLIAVQPGGPVSTTSVSSSTSTQSTTSIGGSYANSPDDLQLQLSVYASSSGGTSGGVAIQMYIGEYNTLASANNVSKASAWGLQGLSLGACGTEAYPFGVALYRGSYSAANVSQATPLRIYPVVACPMLLRLITSYLFQPNSDLAVILPGSDATPTPMSQNVTATTEYSAGAGFVASSSPLGPGTYSVAAGDEWGSVVVIHFTVGGSTSSTTSTETQSATSSGQASSGLQLRLSVSAFTNASGAVVVQMHPSEFNTLASANNVSRATNWALQGLALGTCGTLTYPFGVALYSGTYTAANVSLASPIKIFRVVACPELAIRYVSGYLFQPSSDLAVILPGGSDATPTEMAALVNATGQYASAANVSSSSPLAPGTYSVAAGDEWGTVVVVHFTVRAGSTTSTTTSTTVIYMGALDANFSIGPTQPVCSANSTVGPAPAQYSSIEAIITSQQSGQNTTLPIAWTSNGCSASGSFEAPLPSGSYSLDLSNCTFMGCSSALPKSFTVAAGQATSVEVSIDTGIR